MLYFYHDLNSVTYGYVTWEWKEGLRGFTYPLFFAFIYKLLYFINCDSVHLLASSHIFYPDDLYIGMTKYISCSHFAPLILVCFVLQIWLPRIIQALFAAFADVKFFFLIRRLESGDVAKWTVRSSPIKLCESLQILATEYSSYILESYSLFLFCSLVLLPYVLVVLVVLLHQDSDQQHGDHPHLSGSVLLPTAWIPNTQQVSGL